MIWVRLLLQELGWLRMGPFLIKEDNLGAIKWGTSNKRKKHVENRYHFVREKVNRREIELEYSPTTGMLADLPTKPFLRLRFM